MTGSAPSLSMTGVMSGSPQLNMTEVAPALDLSEPSGDLAERTANLSLDDSVDPFQPSTHARLLTELSVPVSAMHGYRKCDGKMPQVKLKNLLTLGEDMFYVSECRERVGLPRSTMPPDRTRM